MCVRAVYSVPSPLLFNLFISDLAKKFDNMEGRVQLGNRGINSLFWADDLVLFAKTKEGLNSILKTLEGYCNENYLMINTKKRHVRFSTNQDD